LVEFDLKKKNSMICFGLSNIFHKINNNKKEKKNQQPNYNFEVNLKCVGGRKL